MKHAAAMVEVSVLVGPIAVEQRETDPGGCENDCDTSLADAGADCLDWIGHFQGEKIHVNDSK